MTNCVAEVRHDIPNIIGFLIRLFPKSREFPTYNDPKKRGVVNVIIQIDRNLYYVFAIT